ncbi:MAG: cytochrome c biogenesis protein CcdA, partial [Chitinophagaceae bacterium]
SKNNFSEEAPIGAQLTFDTSLVTLIKDSTVEVGNLTEGPDPNFENTSVRYFSDSVTWQQIFDASSADSLKIQGTISYFIKNGEAYNNYTEPFKITSVEAVQDQVKASGNNLGQNLQTKSLLWIFFASFAGGLLALLTPCVYSMIPVTVSFFTKRSKTRKEGIRNAAYYSVSIVLIFTILGFILTYVFGPGVLNKLATNWIANLFFFLLFLVFGISFLGAFEITLPSGWTNKTDSRANTKNFGGIFFMALTLALVSFSCTGPIIGNLIVLASQGSFLGPLVGMFGFSVALALPFTLFALFPGWLNGLGKAGGWLNAVKVSLGFLELALALKFFSNADLARGWRLLDREVFLAFWIVIFALLGFYLLGKLTLSHDDELPKNDFGVPHVGIPRLMLAMFTFAFVVYLVPGLWGAPLKGVSAFLPPYGTQDFLPTTSSGELSPSTKDTASTLALPVAGPVKHVAELGPLEPEVVKKYGLVTYFDYEEALAASRAARKPLMLDFTGINCINCRKMEAQVWSSPEVMKRLKANFIIASLYTDVQNIELPENEQFDSEPLSERVNTLGEKYAHFQVSRYGSLSQPFYIFLDGKEQKLADDGYAYDSNVDRFIKHLDKVVAEYNKRQ